MIIKTATGQVIGKVDGTVFKKVVMNKHMLRKPEAWCIDTRALEMAKRAGCITVEIHNRETHLLYTATIADIESKGFTVNYGYGEQTALCLTNWEIREKEIKNG